MSLPQYGSSDPIDRKTVDDYQSTIIQIPDTRNETSKNNTFIRTILVLIVAVVLSIVAVYGMRSDSSRTFFKTALDETSDLPVLNDDIALPIINSIDIGADVVITPDIDIDSDELQFKMSRAGYAPLNLHADVLYYEFLNDYDVIIEPSAQMQLMISGYTDSSVFYKYTVCPTNAVDTEVECGYGTLSVDESIASETVTVPCVPYDQYSITVDEVSSLTGDISRTATAAGLCLYVRREIRTLTESDLTNTMDALYTMYSVNESVGKELYGNDYHFYAYALNFHHFNSAWQDADHIHEGNGFLAQHIKMTNIVEKSMQAVDPSVTLPYWDFTIDQSEGKSSVSSAVMTPTIFGSMSQPTDLTWGYTYENDLIENGMIINGRWAYLTAEMNTLYDDLKSGYGYMRAPWNMNPSPYVSRFTMDLQIGISLPSCAQHYEMLQYTDMMSYFYDIQYGPHATTHSLTGGIYGCDMLKPMWEAGYANDETAIKTICANWIFYLKEFYRYDYLIPWNNCTIANDTQASTCGFTCNSEYSTEMLFNLKNKISSYVPSDGMGDDGWAAWIDFICEGDGQKIFSGDHLESASPADPSFWVIHPALERLTHAKLMAGGFDTEDWAADPVNEKVCDKSQCYVSAYGSKDYYELCCYGHYEDSQFLDFTTGNKSNHYGDTNGRTMTMTDPRLIDYAMPYIYDGFTWNHCSQDFDVLIENLASDTPIASSESSAFTGPSSSGKPSMSSSTNSQTKSTGMKMSTGDSSSSSSSSSSSTASQSKISIGKSSDSSSDSSDSSGRSSTLDDSASSSSTSASQSKISIGKTSTLSDASSSSFTLPPPPLSTSSTDSSTSRESTTTTTTVSAPSNTASASSTDLSSSTASLVDSSSLSASSTPATSSLSEAADTQTGSTSATSPSLSTASSGSVVASDTLSSDVSTSSGTAESSATMASTSSDSTASETSSTTFFGQLSLKDFPSSSSTSVATSTSSDASISAESSTDASAERSSTETITVTESTEAELSSPTSTVDQSTSSIVSTGSELTSPASSVGSATSATVSTSGSDLTSMSSSGTTATSTTGTKRFNDPATW